MTEQQIQDLFNTSKNLIIRYLKDNPDIELNKFPVIDIILQGLACQPEKEEILIKLDCEFCQTIDGSYEFESIDGDIKTTKITIL